MSEEQSTMTGPEYQAYNASRRWVTLPREQWEQTLLCPGDYTDWRVRCANEPDQFVAPGDVPTFAWDMADYAEPPSAPIEQLITPPAVGALPPIAPQPLEVVSPAPAVYLPQATPAPAPPVTAPGLAVQMPAPIAPALGPAPLARWLTQPFVACVLPAAAAVGAYAYRAGDELLTRAVVAAGAFFAAHAVIGRARTGAWAKPYELCAPPCPPATSATPAATPQLAPVAPPIDAGANAGTPMQNYQTPGGDIVA